MQAGRLADKVVLVAGATGMAAAAAERIATDGARVFVTSRTAADCDALVARIAAAGGDAASQVADLRDEGAVDGLFSALAGRYGRLDGVFHVAGASGRRSGDGPVHEASLEGWDETLRMNLTTTFLVLRAGVRQLLLQGAGPAGRGSIVLMGSITARHPSPERFGTHAYAAAKAAIEGLVTTTAGYYAPAGIRINGVAPGLVRTRMSARAQGDPLVQAAAAGRQPLVGAFLEPQDIAPAVVYLLSDESRAVTGQIMAVDGGWSVSDGTGWAGPETAG